MKAHVLGSGVYEAEEVIHYVLMEARQLEGFASERCTVYLFSLLVTDCLFYDPDNKLRTFVSELIFWVVEVSEKSLD